MKVRFLTDLPYPQGEGYMPFQICMKTDKTLQQLAAEIRDLFALPPYTFDSHTEEPYCQFEMLGMLLFVRQSDEESQDQEVRDYPYCLDMQLSFTEWNSDNDQLEYNLQPYYAQLLAFRLGVDTACYEKKRIGERWKIHYHYYTRNTDWSADRLFDEPGYVPAIQEEAPSDWRPMHTLL